MREGFETDVLGAPYSRRTIGLGSDAEGDVVATLVHRASVAPTRRAVLHVHGFADYFFHTELAEWWAERGYDFFALDLRKAGRSLLPHQTAHFVEDLGDYFADLDAAWSEVSRDHDHVIASAHSTGGLVVPLWAHHRRPSTLTALVLNAPWFDMQGSAWLRSLPGKAALDQLGARQPRLVIPRTVTGVYGQSLHRDHAGEFDFDLAWKPLESFPVHAGWLRAVRRGHAELHRGLDIAVPSLVLSSMRSSSPTELGEDVHSTDVVLDVRQIRRWASSLGCHVTSIAIEGARHDVVLSRPDVRAEVYGQLDRWLRTYVEDDPAAGKSS